jgi:acetoin utilization deacetylase AcuC-like enzyme
MSAHTTAYISHPDCWKHDPGNYHPERPARMDAINDRFIASGLFDHLDQYEAPLATDEDLARVHPAGYIESVREAADDARRQGQAVYLDPDTAMGPTSLPGVLRAAGAGVLATDLVMEGKVRNAFCSVRPCGHHAESDRAMGFCFFNNIAVAAAHAVEHWGLDRVAVIDFDVHHGNGTEEMLSNKPEYLMCSIFQHPFYPGSGTQNPASNMVNVPLPRGSRGDALKKAVLDEWIPALRKFKPQMIFISAGFDAHVEDDMAGLAFVESDYAWVTQQLVALADELCEGRIVSMLEGGYNLSALGRSAEAHVRVLAGLNG